MPRKDPKRRKRGGAVHFEIYNDITPDEILLRFDRKRIGSTLIRRKVLDEVYKRKPVQPDISKYPWPKRPDSLNDFEDLATWDPADALLGNFLGFVENMTNFSALLSGPANPFFWVAAGVMIYKGITQGGNPFEIPETGPPPQRPYTPEEKDYFSKMKGALEQYKYDLTNWANKLSIWADDVDKALDDVKGQLYYGERDENGRLQLTPEEKRTHERLLEEINTLRTPPPVIERVPGDLTAKSLAQRQALEFAQEQSLQSSRQTREQVDAQQLESAMTGVNNLNNAQSRQAQQAQRLSDQRSQALQRVLDAALQRKQTEGIATPGQPVASRPRKGAPPPAKNLVIRKSAKRPLVGSGGYFPLLDLIMSEFNMSERSALKYIKKYGSN
jgi:DNA segregation ATPase FtsK/SpoIIIE-like protein